MKLGRRLIAGLGALIWRSRIERELDEELRTYLDAVVEAKIADGLPHHAAVRAARAEMGSAEAIKDHVRDVGWETHLDAFARDLRYGVRSLLRSPRFTVPSLLTLALGIGATAAMFSVLGAVLLEPLPVPPTRSRVGHLGNQPRRDRAKRHLARELCRVARTRPHPRPSRHGGAARTRDHAQRPTAAGQRPDGVLRRLSRAGRATGARSRLHRRRGHAATTSSC